MLRQLRFAIVYNCTTKLQTVFSYEEALHKIKQFENVMHCSRRDCWYAIGDATVDYQVFMGWLDALPSREELI